MLYFGRALEFRRSEILGQYLCRCGKKVSEARQISKTRKETISEPPAMVLMEREKSDLEFVPKQPVENRGAALEAKNINSGDALTFSQL